MLFPSCFRTIVSNRIRLYLMIQNCTKFGNHRTVFVFEFENKRAAITLLQPPLFMYRIAMLLCWHKVRFQGYKMVDNCTKFTRIQNRNLLWGGWGTHVLKTHFCSPVRTKYEFDKEFTNCFFKIRKVCM